MAANAVAILCMSPICNTAAVHCQQHTAPFCLIYSPLRGILLLLLLLLQNPCVDGAAPDASGACVCSNSTTPAFNGSSLIACLNGTNLASCPASAPVEVKTLANVPVVVQCITESTPCPTGFTLVLYSGKPSVRQECRPNQGGCNYAGYSLQVRAAHTLLLLSGVLMPCVVQPLTRLENTFSFFCMLLQHAASNVRDQLLHNN